MGMKIAAVVSLLMCVACAPQYATGYEGDPTENAIALYEQIHQPLTDKCREQALNVEFEVASILTVQHECKCTTDCGGCMDSYDVERGGHAWVMEDAPEWMIAHETMHVILHCMRAPHDDGDGRHLDAVWQDSRVTD